MRLKDDCLMYLKRLNGRKLIWIALAQYRTVPASQHKYRYLVRRRKRIMPFKGRAKEINLRTRMGISHREPTRHRLRWRALREMNEAAPCYHTDMDFTTLAAGSMREQPTSNSLGCIRLALLASPSEGFDASTECAGWHSRRLLPSSFHDPWRKKCLHTFSLQSV